MHTARSWSSLCHSGGQSDVSQKRLVQELTFDRRPRRLSAKILIASSIATVIGFSAICTKQRHALTCAAARKNSHARPWKI